jgi:LysR family glycine cleavage system transcriptional activator
MAHNSRSANDDICNGIQISYMKNLNRVQLSGLRAVEAVARLGSLASAAEELGVTPGAISQQLRKTEDQLGVALFDRRAKGLVLTASGEVVAPRLTLGMGELSAALDSVLARTDGPLVVSVAPVLAAKWLVWRLADFGETHPEIRIRVDATAATVDPNATDVDVCIRFGEGQWRDVVARKLSDQHVFPVCRPAMLERLRTPADLTRVPVIRDRGTRIDWNLWLAPNGLADAPLIEGPVYSDASLCLDAAIAGQGVFLAWETLAFDALQAGQLAIPFPDRHPTGKAHWFVVGRHTRADRRISIFETWLRREFEASARRPAQPPTETSERVTAA